MKNTPKSPRQMLKDNEVFTGFTTMKFGLKC